MELGHLLVSKKARKGGMGKGQSGRDGEEEKKKWKKSNTKDNSVTTGLPEIFA